MESCDDENINGESVTDFSPRNEESKLNDLHGLITTDAGSLLNTDALNFLSSEFRVQFSDQTLVLPNW